MAVFVDHLFVEDRMRISAWAHCFFEAQTIGISRCDPYPLNKGFPVQLFFVCSLYMLVLLLFIRSFLAFPISSLVLGIFINKRNVSTQMKKRQLKFVSSFIECCFYTIFFSVGAWLLSKQSWMYTLNIWEETPANNISAHVLLFYLFYGARYVAMCFSLLVLDTKKKDFVEMILHHVITLCLIVASFMGGYIRIGLVVMLVFDAADPFLHLAKMFNYIKQTFPKIKPLSWVTDMFLTCFALVFTLTRIGIFSYLIYKCTYDSYLSVDYKNGPRKTSWLESFYTVGYQHHLCVVLMWGLYALQWFWFSLLIKTIYKFLILGVTDDARSDEEDAKAHGGREEEEEEKGKKKKQ